MPSIPLGLIGYAKRKYVELAKELSLMKVITRHDSHILEHVAKEFLLMQSLEKILKKEGLFYHSTTTETTEDTVMPTEEKIIKKKTKVTQSRIKSHPALTARNQCWANIMKGLQECGLTPSTRGKLKVVVKEETNAFAAFLNSGSK